MLQRKTHAKIFAGCVTLLLLGHVFEFRGRFPGLIWGAWPWDLLYHLLWMAAATVCVLHMTTKVWPK